MCGSFMSFPPTRCSMMMPNSTKSSAFTARVSCSKVDTLLRGRRWLEEFLPVASGCSPKHAALSWQSCLRLATKKGSTRASCSIFSALNWSVLACLVSTDAVSGREGHMSSNRDSSPNRASVPEPSAAQVRFAPRTSTKDTAPSAMT